MSHAITIGDVLKFVLIAGGIAILLGVALAILAAFGRGMSR